MIEVVLPEEYRAVHLVNVGKVLIPDSQAIGETHITRHAFSINLHIATISTLQRHPTLSAVDDTEVCLFTVVIGMGVIKHTVPQGNGRTSCCLVDDADGLAVRNIPAAVGPGLFHCEVVELGIAAGGVLSFEC